MARTDPRLARPLSKSASAFRYVNQVTAPRRNVSVNTVQASSSTRKLTSGTLSTAGRSMVFAATGSTVCSMKYGSNTAATHAAADQDGSMTQR